MGEKRIDELNLEQYPSYYHYLPIDRDIEGTSKMKTDYFGRANDSSDIRCLGNTNTTGAIIPSGKYFYKYDTYHSNRALAKAISNIAVNATLTENTNFKYVTIGEELDSLNAALSDKQDKLNHTQVSITVSANSSVAPFSYYGSAQVSDAEIVSIVCRVGGSLQIALVNYNPSGTIYLYTKSSGTYVIDVYYL